MNKNIFIFDVDGVIIDSEPFWREVQINGPSKHGITVTAEDCMAKDWMIKGSLYRAIRDIFKYIRRTMFQKRDRRLSGFPENCGLPRFFYPLFSKANRTF